MLTMHAHGTTFKRVKEHPKKGGNTEQDFPDKQNYSLAIGLCLQVFLFLKQDLTFLAQALFT